MTTSINTFYAVKEPFKAEEPPTNLICLHLLHIGSSLMLLTPDFGTCVCVMYFLAATGWSV